MLAIPIYRDCVAFYKRQLLQSLSEYCQGSVNPRCSLCLCGGVYLGKAPTTETQRTLRVHRENKRSVFPTDSFRVARKGQAHLYPGLPRRNPGLKLANAFGLGESWLFRIEIYARTRRHTEWRAASATGALRGHVHRAADR